MAGEPKDNQIVRAWLLVYAEAENLEEFAKSIRKEVNDRFRDSEKSFIIRADLTDGPFNMIMAISAENDDLLDGIIDKVRKNKEVKQYLVARVLIHVPEPPHKSPGFVTEKEANPLEGLLGENAWG